MATLPKIIKRKEMKIHDLIHKQSCRIDAIEETLRKENEKLAEMQNLQIMINSYKENSIPRLYNWLVDNGCELSVEQMAMIDKIAI